MLKFNIKYTYYKSTFFYIPFMVDLHEFEFEIILGDYEFNVYGCFQLDENNKTEMPIEVEFKLRTDEEFNFKIPIDYIKNEYKMDISVLELNRENILYISKVILENKFKLHLKILVFATYTILHSLKTMVI